MKQEISRREFLNLGFKIGCGVIASSVIPNIAQAETGLVTKINNPTDIFIGYIDRKTGKVVYTESFINVNPELKDGFESSTPYKAPNKNVYVGNAPSIVKEDILRYGIVDIEKRNEGLGFFSSLKDSYKPGEYTHHVVLNLCDRLLGEDGELNDIVNENINSDEKKRAEEFLYKIHQGYNGDLIINDPKKLAEAIRFYNGRETIVPRLYLNNAPEIGELAFIGENGILVASNRNNLEELAFINKNNVKAEVELGIETAKAISDAAEGATSGISAVGASIGNTASVGNSAGASSKAGDGGSGSGGSGGSSGSGAGSGGGGASDSGGGTSGK